MGGQLREFSPEYKDEAVLLVINTGRTVVVVARELGINEATLNEAILGRWVNLHEDRQGAGDTPLRGSEQVELARRCAKEVAELKLDRGDGLHLHPGRARAGSNHRHLSAGEPPPARSRIRPEVVGPRPVGAAR